MPSYLVESYSPRTRMAAGEATTRVDGGRDGVRHLRTTFVPSDEMCLHLVEAPSLEALRRALTRAGVAYERVVEAFERPVAAASARSAPPDTHTARRNDEEG